MGKKNQHEDRAITVQGSICDGGDSPIAGIRGALLHGDRIVSLFTTADDGCFSAEAHEASHVAFASLNQTPSGQFYLLMNDRAVIEIPEECDGEWTMPPLHLQQISGKDCVAAQHSKLRVTSCGQPANGFPMVGLNANHQAHQLLLTHRGEASVPSNISAIAPAASAEGDNGDTYTYSGDAVINLDDLADGELKIASSSTKEWISGRVVTDCGEPVPDVCVLLLDSNKVLVANGKAVTNAQGEYRFDVPVTGAFVVFGNEHRDACSKCCLHLVTDALVEVPGAGECGRRLVPTAIYDGCCLPKLQPAGTMVRGKVLDNCNQVLEEACVLLLKGGQPVNWKKTVSGAYQFGEDGDTVVFCPEFVARGRNYQLLTPTIVTLPCPDKDGIREAPAAIYAGRCSHEIGNPQVVAPQQPDRSALHKLLANFEELGKATALIKEQILKSGKLIEADRAAVMQRLDSALQTIQLQIGATKAQKETDGASDAAFVQGAGQVLRTVEASLRKIADQAARFVSQGRGEVLSAAAILSVFQDELKSIAPGENQ